MNQFCLSALRATSGSHGALQRRLGVLQTYIAVRGGCEKCEGSKAALRAAIQDAMAKLSKPVKLDKVDGKKAWGHCVSHDGCLRYVFELELLEPRYPVDSGARIRVSTSASMTQCESRGERPQGVLQQTPTQRRNAAASRDVTPAQAVSRMLLNGVDPVDIPSTALLR